MASPRSVDSGVPETRSTPACSMNEHIKNITTSLTSTVKIARILGEALGNGTLKQGKKLKFDDGTAIGVEDLASYVSSIKHELRKIPKMITDERKAEKANKRRRRMENSDKDYVQTVQPPSQFTMPLIEFFRSVNLGQDPTGRGRLQDYADMTAFFTNGIGSLPFGVSLFNVFGNVYKQQSGNAKVYLDDAAQFKLKAALDSLRKKKEEDLAEALSNPEATEKEREGRRSDLERLKKGEIQIKDCTRILTYYRVKEVKDAAGNTVDMSGWAPHVANMISVTKQLNSNFHAKKDAAAAAAPKGTAAPAPLPVVTKAPAPVPVIPTVNARGASPVVSTRRR